MNKVTKRLTKKDIFTIPNAISVFRLLLIPVILILYIGHKEYTAAAIVVLLSGASDIADGQIARRCNMISDLGKFLDPVADKLTQAAIMICLSTKYKEIWILVGVFALKELAMLLIGILVLRRTDTINGAQWYGKLNTVILELSMIALIVFPMIPEVVAVWMIRVCIASIIISFLLYCINFYRILSKKKSGEAQDSLGAADTEIESSENQ